MVTFEFICAVAKEQRKTTVDAHRCEVAVLAIEAEPKDLREKAGRSFLVTRWNDGVVEHDRHRPSPAGLNALCLSIWPNLREDEDLKAELELLRQEDEALKRHLRVFA